MKLVCAIHRNAFAFAWVALSLGIVPQNSIAGTPMPERDASQKIFVPECADQEDSARKDLHPGHYIAMNRFDTSEQMVDAMRPGVKGIQKRYTWNSLEPDRDVYDLSGIQGDLQLLEKHGGQLVVFLEDKSFDGKSPVPRYLDDFVLNNRHGGYTVKRWDPYVVERMKRLVAEIGRQFDCSINFEGLAIQESALSLEDAVLRENGYSPGAYRDALIAMLTAAAISMPRSRVFWYMNFLRGGQKNIAQIAEAIAPFGVAMGGPDVLPGQRSLEQLTYPLYKRFRARLPLFNSIQYDSYGHPKDVNSQSAGYWTMTELFEFAHDDLHVSYLFWNRKTWRKPPDSFDWTDALPVIERTADFALD